MPGKMSLQVGYVGTRGMRLPVFLDANLVGQTPHGMRNLHCAGCEQQRSPRRSRFRCICRPTVATQALSSFNTGYSVANTWYNSLAVTVRRPFANGLEVLMNYTWAQATDDGQVQGANGTFYGGDTPTGPEQHPVRQWTVGHRRIRNRLTLSFVYQPKIMAGQQVGQEHS